MKFLARVWVGLCALGMGFIPLMVTHAAKVNYNFDTAIQSTTEKIGDKIYKDVVNEKGADAVNVLIEKIVLDIAIPLLIFVGAIIAIIGFYIMMVKTETSEISKGTNYIIWWVIGIVVMMLAHYIAGVLRSNDVLMAGVSNKLDLIQALQAIYQKIAYPLLKVWLYLGIGVLFILLVINVFKYVTNDEGTNQKSLANSLIASVIGLIVIMWSKQLVEFVYGKQGDVLHYASNLGEVGSGILSDKHLPILYEILKWVMSLTTFVIVVIIIFLWFKMLTNPESDENLTTIKKYALYVAIGIVVIGACYLITNFLIVT